LLCNFREDDGEAERFFRQTPEPDMPNPLRGEISARLGGRDYTLCLTLGALAELELALGAGDLMGLAERFEAGRLSAREAIAVIGAGLRGAGHQVSDDEVARLPVDGGAAVYVRLVADLLEATFAAPDAAAVSRTKPGAATAPVGCQTLFGFAVAGLGLSSREAWAATPRELALAAIWLSGTARDAPARADLAALMARFPD
jgi:hypothetical protein